MIGVLFNSAVIIVCGLIGVLIGGKLPKRLEQPVLKAEGLAVIVIGLNGVLTSMLSVEDGRIKSSGELMLLLTVVIGCVIGELLDIDCLLNRSAAWIETKIGRKGFSAGFVSASLIFCVGAMSIMGPIQYVTSGDLSLLSIKCVLDGVTSIVLGATLGYGVIFSCVPVFLIEGGFALFARAVSSVPQNLLNNVYMVGYLMVMAVGINFISDKKIKTANLLPAIVLTVMYNMLISFQHS